MDKNDIVKTVDYMNELVTIVCSTIENQTIRFQYGRGIPYTNKVEVHEIESAITKIKEKYDMMKIYQNTMLMQETLTELGYDKNFFIFFEMFIDTVNKSLKNDKIYLRNITGGII